MLENLKTRVLKENINLVKHNLVILTWGNVSAIDREQGLVVIKPSGVEYSKMTEEDMVVVDLNGKVVEGNLRPSSDLETHLEIYKTFKNIGGIVHTHSTYATAWAQALRDIPAYGTTHADCFYGHIPCTRTLSEEEIKGNYERNTGKLIVETLTLRRADVLSVPGIVIASHGPFAWGESPEKAVINAVTLEEVAKMAYFTESINKTTREISTSLKDKHYYRKHGSNAYYGQNSEDTFLSMNSKPIII